MRILDDMDDAITDIGGDEDEYGRRKLAKIRRCKDHIRKALEHVRLTTPPPNCPYCNGEREISKPRVAICHFCGRETTY